LKFSLSVKGFGRDPVIEPRHLVGSRQERLGRDRIPLAEDLRSDHTQQGDQQQTGSNAKGGEESNSHNASFTLDVQFARKLSANQAAIEQLLEKNALAVAPSAFTPSGNCVITNSWQWDFRPSNRRNRAPFPSI
jgi:hypothetical protein